MRKILLVFVLLGLLNLKGYAISDTLSDKAEVILFTVSPGDDLYSCFGHNALFIYDTAAGVRKVYNYGTFDFSDPDFYLNFTRGKLRYMLSVDDTQGLFSMAAYENRSITQQVINLSRSQKQKLYDYLENNSLPENKFYKYDFFYDNCSSRLRDVFVQVCGDSLDFHLKNEGQKSFRNLIDPYLKDKQYQDLGMDLGLGLPSDKIATPFQYMFLPEYLMNDCAQATVIRNGKLEKFVYNQKIVLPSQPKEKFSYGIFHPWIVFTSFFLLVFGITWYQYKKDLNGYWLDAILFTFTGLFGIVLLFLWFGTDHGVTIKNYNLIWAHPLHLVAVLFLVLKKKQKLVGTYFLINFFTLFILLTFWTSVPQELNLYTIPFMLALAVRSMYIYSRLSKQNLI